MLSITACSHAGGVAPRRVQNSTRSTSSSSFRNGRSTNSGGRTNNGRNRSSSIIRYSSSRAWAHSAPQMMLYLALGCSILLPSFPRSRVEMYDPKAQRCTISCQLGLGVASQCYAVRFVLLPVLGSKGGPSAKMYDMLAVSWARRGRGAKLYSLLPVSWARSGVPVARCTICCRCLGLEVGSRPNAKTYVLLPLIPLMSWISPSMSFYFVIDSFLGHLIKNQYEARCSQNLENQSHVVTRSTLGSLTTC